MVKNDMPILANILGVVFIIWLIADLIITVFVRTGKSFISYIISK